MPDLNPLSPESVLASESSPSRSELYYDSARLPHPFLRELQELWRYRDLLRLLVGSSIKTRYKRSALGVLWTLLNPLLSTLVMTVAFSALFRFELHNYSVYLLSGLLLWNFFTQTTLQSMHMLIWGSSLLKRIYIPRAIFAAAVLGNGLINLLLALIPLALVMLVLGHPFRPALLFLPAAMLIAAMFTLGLGLLISTLAIFFVDVVDIYGVLISAWFYLTPIIYPETIIPPQFAWVLWLNPMRYMVELFRTPIYLGTGPSLSHLAVAFGLALSTLLLGWWSFTRKADEFAYRI